MDEKQILERANQYISYEKHDTFRGEVEELVKNNDIKELSERFYTDLKFGTGGLRGIIGGGFNRMNSFTVQRATQGLANYVNKAVTEGEKSAVIAYDCRNYSDLFALEAARVFAAAGIKTYLFTSLRPTPELSYAVRHFGATTGIVVTASHNPPKYNGYKVYWNDGSQIVAPHDTAIVEEVLGVTDVNAMDKEEALEKGLIEMIDKDVDDKFIDMVKRQAIRPELIKEKGKDVTVVFTPLHGTGSVSVSRALSEMGMDVLFVKEQQEPDGNFSTVASPNPEEASALKMAIDLAKEKKADLIMATDPDADRLGIAVPGPDGEYVLITGNQLGALLADYIFTSRKENGTLPEKPAFIKTIVTTELQTKIAQAYGAACFDVLTGFKFIGEKIRQFETGSEGYTYVFGGEESYGYLNHTEARDKDAVSAATLTAEMALYHRSEGRTILEQLDIIWEKYGCYKELLVSKVFEGQEGVQIIQNLMSSLRDNPPADIAGLPVASVKDYGDGTTLTLASGSKDKNIDLPSSNVLQFILEDGSIVTARPSGTEPKIKFYASCCAPEGTPLAEAKDIVNSKIAQIKEYVDTL